MNNKLLTQSLIAAGLIAAIPYASASSNSFDARSSAMGGVGVASAHFGAAPLTNPALLATSRGQDKISLIAPSIGAQASDPANLIDGFDDVTTAWDNLENALGSGNEAEAAGKLADSVAGLAGEHANANLGLSMVLAVPDDELPVALSVNSWAKGHARALVSQSDLDYLDDVAKGIIIPGKDDLDKLTSRAEGMAALVTEYGVTVAHPFTLGELPVGVGITPKIQRIETWNYNVAINNYDSSDLRDGNWQHQTMSANIDAGFFASVTPEWMVALSAQNLFENKVKTREINGYQPAFIIRPELTAGTAWNNERVTLSADIDLTPVSNFQYVDKNQYAAFGAELRAADWVQLRAGYRLDMRGNDRRVVTGGVGLSAGEAMQFDLTAMAGRDRTIGGVAQFTFHF
ncbi:TPA: conjugal transfer protein TraF [Enterobacter ludwigii]|uniref:conjugal transfer protein TraF n=1 Tax=Enterobacter TaxID=547 RepID=UPI0015F6F187|nr:MULTISPECIES: conjugal transfer protein TraF [Enterobacter]MBA7773714.1 conjugal transfer protein TraF [Enterobacter sp. RHBSTW-00974]MBA7778877.1 conjugal transfer protein TraF [Enterobacter sp. RHBSTW-00318]MBA7831480.1 conjugal transfer protein TraF [Enterobacter sp. RHBSTW-00340]MBA8039019.1 conjugal transfer protein TraF [Enterobacter sp. RHBSTW-00131]MBG0585221.1 conjugal transfer protein TraF [Enterobacter ludwigii]